MKLILFDLEVYTNLFVAVFYDPKENKHTVFTVWNDINQIRDLRQYLKDNENTYFIGYNSLGYDMNILTRIVKAGLSTAKEIKEFNDELINSEWPIYREDKLCNKTIDLMLVNNYGPRGAKTTSLKALEFILRKKSIKDLPYHFNDEIKTLVQVNEIIKYCKYDVEVTRDVFNITKELIKLRIEFGKLYDINFLNSPEPDLVKKYFAHQLSKKMGIDEKEIKKLKSYPQEIIVKDIILPHIKIDKIQEFIDIFEFYKGIRLEATLKSSIGDKRLISLKNAINREFIHNETKYTYAAGGLHACIKEGIYESDDEYIIEDFDKVSFYPHFSFKHGVCPAHFPKDVYASVLEDVFNKRMTYPKKTHFLLNYAFKIIINVQFGLSNSEYGLFFDTNCTLATTVNGMLTLTMLLDKLYNEIEDLTVIQGNTDGITIRYKRKDIDKVHAIYDWLTEIDGIPYELVEYKKMIINDVNNYMGIYNDGSTKTKGVFETHADLIKSGAYHKDSSASIIPQALQEYFKNGTPIEDTINNHNNIYDFCYGVKGSGSYSWLLTTYNSDLKVAKSELMNHRFLRYYAGGNQTISKFWTKGKKQDGIDAIEANTPVTLALNIPKEEIFDYKKGIKVEKIKERYPNLNKDWYISQTYKIVNKIENQEII